MPSSSWTPTTTATAVSTSASTSGVGVGVGGRVLPPAANSTSAAASALDATVTQARTQALALAQPLLPPPPPLPLPPLVQLDDHHAPSGSSVCPNPTMAPPPTPIPLTGPVPPLVWSTRHREQLVHQGYPSAVAMQGVSRILGVTNYPDPSSLDARAAQLQSVTTSATGQRHARTACGRTLLCVPDMDVPTHVGSPTHPRSVAAHDPHLPKSGLPLPASTPSSSSPSRPHTAPWRIVPHKWRYRGRPRILVTAHDQRAFAVTLFLIVVLPGLYYGFVAPAVWNDLGLPWAVGLSVWLHVTAFAALWMTSFSDPGILPTFTHLHFDRSPVDPSGQPDTPLAPRVLDPDPYDFTYNNLGFQVRYCSTCKIYRGPRTFHCSICDACIAHHDHHCPYTSNCIGRGNYRYFVTFLSHALALNVLVGVLCVLLLVHAATLGPPDAVQDDVVSMSSSATRAFNQHPMALFLAIACGLLCFTLVPLTTYHWYLSLLNMTTHEHMRYGPDPNWRNPWRHPGWLLGPLRNLGDVLCRPLPRQNLVWYRPVDSVAELDEGSPTSAAC